MAYVQISTQNCKNLALNMQEMIKIYSFDIFDTLLLRPYTDPQGVWKILEEQENCKGFAKFRKEADAKTYATATKEDRETTIEEAYSIMPHKYQALMKKEIELERKVLCANPEMLEKWERAKSEGKKRILVSDMYLPQEIIEDILIEKGIKGWDAFYLSRTYNARKTTGKLFEIMLRKEDVKPNEVLHIGDNIHSDIKIPKSLGISTCQYEKISDQLYKAFPFTKYINQRLTGCIALGYHKFICSFLQNGVNPSYWNKIGYVIGGILGYSYIRWITETARKRGIKRLMFIARDGYIWNKICKELYPEFQTDYIYAPRITSISVLGATGADPIAIEDRKQYIKNNLNNVDNNAIKKEYTKYISRYSFGKEVAIIDGCSSGFSAQCLIEKTIGHPVFTFYEVAMAKMHNAAALLSTDLYTPPFLFLSEFLFGSPEKPIIGIKDNHPIFKKDMSKEEPFKTLVSNDIEKGCIECAKFLYKNNIIFASEQWINFLNTFMQNLTPQDKKSLELAKDAGDIEQKNFNNVIWVPIINRKKIRITRIGRFSVKLIIFIWNKEHTFIISRTHYSHKIRDYNIKYNVITK